MMQKYNASLKQLDQVIRSIAKKVKHFDKQPMYRLDAAASLFDIFVCRQVYFKGDTKISVSRSTRGGVYEVKKFKLEIDFFGLLNNTDQFVYA